MSVPFLPHSKLGLHALKRPDIRKMSFVRSPSPTVYGSSPRHPFKKSSYGESIESGNNEEIWDELGYEGSEHAFIWHIYNDEAGKADAATTDSLNRGIDVLLVFTGLFSAVLTTFIIQSYQQMLPGPSDETNLLLRQLITDLRRSSVFNLGDTPITLPPISGESLVPANGEIRLVNGLWFAALACSLSAALISMLSKQWIQPTPNVSGSPRYRARQRQRRHIQLKRWRVSAVISALPLLLHAALLLFFAGIIVLLWSGEVAIMASTFAIVALAYIFYLTSMWMSLIYPDCPYQHPISEHLRRWVFAKATSRPIPDIEAVEDEKLQSKRRSMLPTVVDPDHHIDASSLVWLLENCSNDETVAATLQAIGGLPKEFTGFHVLRNVGAIPMVLHHFSKCFRRDLSIDMRWHASDPDKAERYCRAWIRLTHGTATTWPQKLYSHLTVLKESSNRHVSAISTCVIALNSLEARRTQLALIQQLEAHASGQTKLTDLTQSWLLDTFFECSLNWELRAAVVSDLINRSVPVLLRLLQQSQKIFGTSDNHVTIPLVLSFLITGKIPENAKIWDDDMYNLTFRQTMVPVLIAVICHPTRYGLQDDLLDFVIIELSQLVAPFFTGSSFSEGIKRGARQGLSKLYLEGRIGKGILPVSVLADILQILHPLTGVTPAQRPLFARILLRTLDGSVDLNIQIGCIRLLEPLLRDGGLPVVRVFTEEGSISTLLRLCGIGDVVNRRLQMDCMRMLCIFIESTQKQDAADLCPSHLASMKRQFDDIFASDFFRILLFTVGSRHWWFPDFADTWLPALVQLCQIRPHEQVWPKVLLVFRDFAENHVGEEGSQRMIDDLDLMRNILSENREPKLKGLTLSQKP